MTRIPNSPRGILDGVDLDVSPIYDSDYISLSGGDVGYGGDSTFDIKLSPEQALFLVDTILDLLDEPL